MDEVTAEKVLRILVLADEGCADCVTKLFRIFMRNWPQYTELAHRVWAEVFEDVWKYD